MQWKIYAVEATQVTSLADSPTACDRFCSRNTWYLFSKSNVDLLPLPVFNDYLLLKTTVNSFTLSLPLPFSY
jgi:hypothetical protein